MECPTGFEPA